MKKRTKRFMSAITAVAIATVVAFGGIGTSVSNAANVDTSKLEAYVDVEKAKVELEAAKVAIEEQIAYVEANYETMYADAYTKVDPAYIAATIDALKVAEKAVEDYVLPVEAQEEIVTKLGVDEAQVALADFACAQADAVAAIHKVHEELAANNFATVEGAYASVLTLWEDAECAYNDLLVVAEIVSPAVVADLQALYDEYAPQVEAAINEFIEAVEAEIAAVEEQIRAEVEAQIEALEAALAELEAAIIAEIEAFEAELQAQLAELEAQLKAAEEAVKAEIQEAIDAVNAVIAEVEAVKAEIEATIDEAIATIEAAIATIETAIEDIDATIAALEAELAAAYAEAMAALADAYEAAITGEYVVDEDSQYLAIGDSVFNASSMTYADEVFAVLNEEYGVEDAMQLILTGFRAEDMHYLLDESYELDAYGVAETKDAADALRADAIAEIEKADFITITLGNDNFTTFVAAQANGANYEMDWARYVTAEGVPYVEATLAEVAAEVAAEVPAMIAPAVGDMIEAYAYAFVGFAANYTAVLDEIHAINPEAEVVVTGLYNPMDDFKYEGVALGEYVDYFIELSNQMFTIYAMATPNTTFVAIPDTEAEIDGMNVGTMQYLLALMGDSAPLLPTEAGHAYIAEQILAAETIILKGLKGDVNLDGSVNSADTALLFDYVLGKAEF